MTRTVRSAGDVPDSFVLWATPVSQRLLALQPAPEHEDNRASVAAAGAPAGPTLTDRERAMAVLAKKAEYLDDCMRVWENQLYDFPTLGEQRALTRLIISAESEARRCRTRYVEIDRGVPFPPLPGDAGAVLQAVIDRVTQARGQTAALDNMAVALNGLILAFGPGNP